ncbi:MAG: hypothetical protein A2513_10695 [Sulfurimonas sp. RIFOXYD12_FULL_33_39]|uniref:sensor domain-containing diguanylate cyclase n=1 Tax=unclassified Sulfurimonas TaxID=2623549 RepID=UPI0008C05C6F|nr:MULTISPECIES: diguanylate cyclase [unclassified Sulfurimonas]OHE06887.1 MAG: hypothetical protein A3G74_01925 [Sulfurimonas sp. RIFCSPLOWO2_12_FULL_34_6]OHE09774.1 MAG: hypothetical protein A2513_10695 [Sulfurimonas sp. RIFOXYD12_FULL_33_39]OHE13718.1 MAG: hypothetical protein A2530_09060 [Sulfurimonas sp. RIFOXYD2_FULL_34_21]DAB28067.1 MAG TPA: hypothetical protein CFH78_04190 [Sulfurimonas sp. UBA10385]
MSNTQKKLLFFISLSVVAFGVIFSLLLYNKNSEINEALKEPLKLLRMSYNQGLDRFEVISKNVYNSFQKDDVFLEMLSNANGATKEEKANLHNQLYNHLKDEYEKLRMLEVMQLQIILPNNESLLRMHKPDSFCDNLTEIRYSIKESNKEKVSISGFEQGKDGHAFRYVYPLYIDGKHIGALDVSFSSTMLQNYTMRASNIHTHFIVNRNVFNSLEWKSNNQEPYEQSIEHEDFMFSMSDHIDHKRLDESQRTLINPLRKTIENKIQIGKEFAMYKELDNVVKVLSFLPIKNVKNDKTVAYLVSYTDSERIKTVIKDFKYFILITVVIILLSLVVIYKIIRESAVLKKEAQYDELTKLYNRKYFLKAAKEEFEKSSRFGHKFSIVMADIDHFKLVNDLYGHQAGDIVLEEVAKIIRSHVRKFDIVARYGGEEFIMLILANAQNSYDVVENIRKKIEDYSFCNELNLKETVSFGIAEFKDDVSIERIIKRADEALYRSKNEGRNRITIY